MQQIRGMFLDFLKENQIEGVYMSTQKNFLLSISESIEQRQKKLFNFFEENSPEKWIDHAFPWRWNDSVDWGVFDKKWKELYVNYIKITEYPSNQMELIQNLYNVNTKQLINKRKEQTIEENPKITRRPRKKRRKSIS